MAEYDRLGAPELRVLATTARRALSARGVVLIAFGQAAHGREALRGAAVSGESDPLAQAFVGMLLGLIRQGMEDQGDYPMVVGEGIMDPQSGEITSARFIERLDTDDAGESPGDGDSAAPGNRLGDR